jgi:hypothetical protein
MSFTEWWSAFEQVLTVRNQRMLAQTAWDFAYEMATKAERERCAAICDEVISEISSYEADEYSKEIKAKVLKGE